MSGDHRPDDKLRYDLIPPGVEEQVVKVLMHGAAKYNEKPGEDDWRRRLAEPNGPMSFYAAARRHIEAWRFGETNDPETKLPHLVHAICRLMHMVAAGVEHKPGECKPLEPRRLPEVRVQLFGTAGHCPPSEYEP